MEGTTEGLQGSGRHGSLSGQRIGRFTTDDAVNLYGLDGWGNGFFAIGQDGHLRVTPGREPSKFIDVPQVVEELIRRGHRTPLLLRFPQLLQAQVDDLAGAFANAIREYNYPQSYHPVFPIKVNQQRQVIEGLMQAGWRHSLGLEVGSLPELLAAAVLPTPPDSVIICNGFKDMNYLGCASLATRLGKQVIVVIEKPFEVNQFLELALHETVLPMVGIRIRLQARGSGLWEKSGGSASKFGLTTSQLITALDQLTNAGLGRQVALLHFHIGSQLTEIRKVKSAVREGARLYAKVAKRGVDLRYLDVGGGLGVDYDGSKTSSDASVNYTVQEYANDVVYAIQEVCQQENVPPPRIVSESGRMLTAYHSILVVDTRGAIVGPEGNGNGKNSRDPQVVQDLAHVAGQLTIKNYRESYHDANEYRDQLYNLFNLGLLSLEDRGRGEQLFWDIASRAVRFSKSAKFVADEFVELEARLHEKYVCNFSVFQSVPDHWALDQLFPVMPIHRLNEPPTRRATLVDITCDSDGAVEKFVDLKDIKEALEVHEIRPNEPYWLGFLLIGAYQDTMGDMHNLFGRVHEADIILDPRGASIIREVRPGETAGDTLAMFGYSEDLLVGHLTAALRERQNRDQLTPGEAEGLLADYRRRLGHYTYLE